MGVERERDRQLDQAQAIGEGDPARRRRQPARQALDHDLPGGGQIALCPDQRPGDDDRRQLTAVGGGSPDTIHQRARLLPAPLQHQQWQIGDLRVGGATGRGGASLRLRRLRRQLRARGEIVGRETQHHIELGGGGSPDEIMMRDHTVGGARARECRARRRQFTAMGVCQAQCQQAIRPRTSLHPIWRRRDDEGREPLTEHVGLIEAASLRQQEGECPPRGLAARPYAVLSRRVALRWCQRLPIGQHLRQLAEAPVDLPLIVPQDRTPERDEREQHPFAVRARDRLRLREAGEPGLGIAVA